MAETVLVTGGNGFVAGWCIIGLLQRGYVVRATVRDLSKVPRVRTAVAVCARRRRCLTFCVADLTRDEGWDAAVAGCSSVLHVASPLGAGPNRDANSLIGPARDGSLRVLRAALKAGVSRVVMTSAAAAARPQRNSAQVSDETVWTDLTKRKFDAYRQSKILAERAAWDFMASKSGPTRLTTILPGAVFGPVLDRDNLGSVQVIQTASCKAVLPALRGSGFTSSTWRDLADLHIRAMTSSEAAGERFLAAGDFLWMAEIAAALRSKLGNRASKVPTIGLPDFVVRLLSLAIPQLRMLTPDLAQEQPFVGKGAESWAFRRVPRPPPSSIAQKACWAET